MSLQSKTIYPVFPEEITNEYLCKFYSPEAEDLKLSQEKTMNNKNQLFFLYLLLSFKRLGYFISLMRFPAEIVSHIATCVNVDFPSKEEREDFDASRQANRYINNIKEHFNVLNYNRNQAFKIACDVAKTKSFLIDIINAAIEQIINFPMELPDYEILEKICIKAKKAVNKEIYKIIYDKLTHSEKNKIQKNIFLYLSSKITGWAKLKEEPKNISIKNIHQCMEHVKWLDSIRIRKTVFEDVPEVKLGTLYEEAITQVFSKY